MKITCVDIKVAAQLVSNPPMPSSIYIIINVCLFRISSKSELLTQISQLRYPQNGRTNTYAGLRCLRQVFNGPMNRPGVTDLAFIITDGEPTLNIDQTEPEAQRAQDEGIRMFAVGITEGVDENTLRFLSSSPRMRNENYFVSPSFTQLREVLDRLLIVACRTVPTTTPTTTTTEGTVGESEWTPCLIINTSPTQYTH